MYHLHPADSILRHSVICFSENIHASIGDLQLLYVVDVDWFHLS